MKLNAYSNSDLNMYLSNTYMLYDNTPIHLSSFENNGSRSKTMYYRRVSGSYISDECETLDVEMDLPLVPVPMGYYTYKNMVVYLYKQQRSHFKKLPCDETLRYFLPQERELQQLHRNDQIDLRKLILKGQEFHSLDEAYEMLQDKKVMSVALHTHYAMVKKGNRKEYVIYYKTDPVITYDGENLVPLIDDCHIRKLKLELGL